MLCSIVHKNMGEKWEAILAQIFVVGGRFPQYPAMVTMSIAAGYPIFKRACSFFKVFLDQSPKCAPFFLSKLSYQPFDCALNIINAFNIADWYRKVGKVG